MEEEDLAENYDSMMKKYQCFGDDAIFGLLRPFVDKGHEMLDIGIGTGEGSIRFHHEGLIIDGIDISAPMLTQCRRKGFTRNLIEHDITENRLPFPDHSYDHVVSTGVMHFFKDLEPIFEEVSRVLRKNGTFTLTVMADQEGGPKNSVLMKMTKWGKEVYLHGREYVERLSADHGFVPVSRLLFVGSIDPEDGELFYNWAFVLRR